MTGRRGRSTFALGRLRAKPALRSVNHCEFNPAATTGATTQQTAVFTGVDPPTNRGTNIPVGAVLTKVRIEVWGVDATPVAGKHQCMLIWQPGATTYADPIASWFSTTEPLTEEAIQVRQNAMGKVSTKYIFAGFGVAPHHLCIWKGRRVIRDGDDVVLCLLDAVATDWEGTCDAHWIE